METRAVGRHLGAARRGLIARAAGALLLAVVALPLAAPAVGAASADGDGLSDALEIQIGTNPFDPDTDGDGLTDGDEYNGNYTSPLTPDTDYDGLDDYEESYVYDTSAVAPDSDFDGVLDGDEIRFGTDPNGAGTGTDLSGSAADADGDGLSDYNELNVYGTDPAAWDTDFDGYGDGYEVETGYLPLNPYCYPFQVGC
jgi:hypothetical protein